MPTAKLPANGERVRLEDYSLAQHEQMKRLMEDSSTIEQVDKEI